MENNDYLYFNERNKRYYYVGNVCCSQCGQPTEHMLRILTLRNKKESSLHIICMNPKCAAKIISSDIYKSAIEHIKALVIDEIPKDCIWVPLKRKFTLVEGRYENAYVAGEFNKNETCEIKDNAFRSKKDEFSLEGAKVVEAKQIVANNELSYAQLLEQDKKYISEHELHKMLSNIAQAQKNAQLETMQRLEEKEKQRSLL